MIRIEKFNPDKIISVVYLEGKQKKYYIKRFQIDQQSNGSKKVNFIGEHPDAELMNISLDSLPRIEVFFKAKSDKKSVENEIIQLADFIALKSYKARGKRISNKEIKKIVLLDAVPCEKEEESQQENHEVKDNNIAETQVNESENNIKVKQKEKEKEEHDKNQQMTIDF